MTTTIIKLTNDEIKRQMNRLNLSVSTRRFECTVTMWMEDGGHDVETYKNRHQLMFMGKPFFSFNSHKSSTKVKIAFIKLLFKKGNQLRFCNALCLLPENKDEKLHLQLQKELLELL
jgi:hypothetical protein